MPQSDPRTVLEDFAAGRITLDQAQAMLAPNVETIDFATIDHDRARRCGTAEVIYGAGKSAEQVVAIARSLVERNGHALVTRAAPEHVDAARAAFDEIDVGERCTAMLIGRAPEPSGTVIPIVTAGASDLAIAEEAAMTCRALGQRSKIISDVGVAGLNRLVARLEELRAADVLVCIAGMEGALPSVVGGLVAAPVIAVPTSIGYGATLHGLAALLGMLTSCASGVSVVNIDNGFGAAYSATLIQRAIDGTNQP